MSFDPITATIDAVKTGIDKIFPDADAEAQRQIAELTTLISARMESLKTELSGNWLQRSWRPILMLSITLIVVNNYLIFPYFSLFGIPATMLDFPDKLWNLLTVGVGGYVLGRSAEKGIKLFKG